MYDDRLIVDSTFCVSIFADVIGFDALLTVICSDFTLPASSFAQMYHVPGVSPGTVIGVSVLVTGVPNSVHPSVGAVLLFVTFHVFTPLPASSMFMLRSCPYVISFAWIVGSVLSMLFITFVSDHLFPYMSVTSIMYSPFSCAVYVASPFVSVTSSPLTVTFAIRLGSCVSLLILFSSYVTVIAYGFIVTVVSVFVHPVLGFKVISAPG